MSTPGAWIPACIRKAWLGLPFNSFQVCDVTGIWSFDGKRFVQYRKRSETQGSILSLALAPLFWKENFEKRICSAGFGVPSFYWRCGSFIVPKFALNFRSKAYKTGFCRTWISGSSVQKTAFLLHKQEPSIETAFLQLCAEMWWLGKVSLGTICCVIILSLALAHPFCGQHGSTLKNNTKWTNVTCLDAVI